MNAEDCRHRGYCYWHFWDARLGAHSQQGEKISLEQTPITIQGPTHVREQRVKILSIGGIAEAERWFRELICNSV